MAADSHLTARLRTTVDETLDADGVWTLSSSAADIRLTLPDRTLTVSEHDAPDGTTRWVLSLSANGETVSKFGPYDSVDALVDQLRTVLKADVGYTVCCDGSPE